MTEREITMQGDRQEPDWLDACAAEWELPSPAPAPPSAPAASVPPMQFVGVDADGLACYV